ncbi:MAG: helix-turn-helix domain-containing protein [Verrucomicrobia bacterium]|nr:helix-turn-helix domain-containing protein [Verrucomicrobiota bacterium]
MEMGGYLAFHSMASGICQRVRRGFVDAWEDIEGIEVAHIRRLHGGNLDPASCKALALFAATADLKNAVSALNCPIWNYSHRLEPLAGVRNIFVDDAELGFLAADHLLGKGYNRFGFIADEDTAFARQRYLAFKERLEVNRFPVKQLICNPSHSSSPLEFMAYRSASIEEWLADLPPPAGIFAANDGVAQLLLDCLHRSLPDAAPLYAVIGVDNAPDEHLENRSIYSLTSINPDFEAVGAALAEEMRNYLSHGLVPSSNTRVIGGAYIIERESTGGVSCEDPLVARLMRRIQHLVNAGEAPRVSELSKFFGVTSRTLLSRFSTVTGSSLRDYMIRARLRRAAHLLLTTEQTISEIAYASGFSKHAALTEHFGKIYSMTPSRYRAQQKSMT